MSTLPLDAIVIGDRVRKDMGDIAGLAKSMKKHGLLHPVVVKSDKTLVAGHRRIEAAKKLGWPSIAVTEIDVADLLSAERDENEERKQFTPSEAVAIGRLIEEQERPKAIENRREAGPRSVAKRRGDAVDESSTAKIDVRAMAAGAVGMGPQKYTEAKAVVAAAEADPKRFGDLVSEMDETGNVRGTFREMERRKASGDAGIVKFVPPPEVAETTPERGKSARSESRRKAAERSAVHRHARHRDQSDEMDRGLIQIETATKVLLTVDPEAVDKTRVAQWVKALTDARSNLGTVLRRLKSVEK